MFQVRSPTWNAALDALLASAIESSQGDADSRRAGVVDAEVLSAAATALVEVKRAVRSRAGYGGRAGG